jgi:hypothetical protein
MERFDDFDYAGHIKQEPDSVKICQKAGQRPAATVVYLD